jgi:hypothetical protein
MRSIETIWLPRFSARSRFGFPDFGVLDVAEAKLAMIGHRIAGRRRQRGGDVALSHLEHW